jgi:hypothetical protein
MNENKNHWLALYLTGKYPGYFKTPDKLLFIDKLQEINPTTFSDEKVKLFGMFGQVDEYEFYLGFINKVERNFPTEFSNFTKALEIPQEILDKINKNKTFNHTELLEEFIRLKWDTDSTTKWKWFEVFLEKFFWSIQWLEVIKIEQAEDEQIDLVIKNNINRPFWSQLGSPLILWEAKNWTSKTNTAVFNNLRGKLSWHKNFSKIWIVIAMNEFTWVVEQNLMRDGASDSIIFPIRGKEIEDLLTSREDPIVWLEERLTWAFK